MLMNIMWYFVGTEYY